MSSTLDALKNFGISPASTVTVDPWWTPNNAMTTSAAVLIFGLITILIMVKAIERGKSVDSLIKLFGMTLVIIGALFLVVAGYSDKQTAPVIGLLGTIVGYVLGNQTATDNTQQVETPSPSGKTPEESCDTIE
ncbi:MAG: hypothetical protein OCC46_00855 [Pseudodesulfovibrio sp.]